MSVDRSRQRKHSRRQPKRRKEHRRESPASHGDIIARPARDREPRSSALQGRLLLGVALIDQMLGCVPGGPPCPGQVDSDRNARNRWGGSTVRAMLKNPVYTGRQVWNRLDFTEAKHSGGGARHRAREEWVVAEEAHLPIVSDEVYEAAQARFEKR